MFYKKSILTVWFAFFALLLILYTFLAGILFNYTKDAVISNTDDKITYALSRVSTDFEAFANGADEIYSALVANGTFNNHSDKAFGGYELYELQKKLAPFSETGINYMLWFEKSDILISPKVSLPSASVYQTYFSEYFGDYEEFCDSVLSCDDRIFSKQLTDTDGYSGDSIVFYQKQLFSPTKSIAVKFIAYTYSDDLLYNSKSLLEDDDFALMFKTNDRIFFSQSDIDGFDPAFSPDDRGNVRFGREKYVASSHHSGSFEYVYVMAESAYSKPLRKVYTGSSLMLVLFFILNIAIIYWFVRRNYKPIRNLLDLLEIQFNYSTNEFDELSKKFSFYKEMQMKTNEELNLKRKVAQHYIMLNIIDNNYVSNEDIAFLFDDIKPYKYSFIAVIESNIQDTSGNILNDAIPDMLCEASENSEVIIRSVLSNGCLIILVNTPTDNSYAFDNMFETICQMSELTHNAKLRIGIGKSCDDLFSINESYSEATRALKHAKSSNTAVFHWEDVPHVTTQAYYYPPELELQLLKSLTVSDFAKAESILEKIYQVNFKERSLSPLIENLLFSNIIGTFSKFIDLSPLTSSIHSVNPENFALNLTKSKTVQEKQELIANILQIYRNTLNSEKQDKDSSIIKSVKKYINQNYTNPDVNVSTTAMHFGVRQDYLSRLFKQHEGINLLKYINVVRLNRAAKMLETTSKNIADIASEVGFYNYRTFTRQFISHFNTTAQQYRDDHRNNG